MKEEIKQRLNAWMLIWLFLGSSFSPWVYAYEEPKKIKEYPTQNYEAQKLVKQLVNQIANENRITGYAEVEAEASATSSGGGEGARFDKATKEKKEAELKEKIEKELKGGDVKVELKDEIEVKEGQIKVVTNVVPSGQGANSETALQIGEKGDGGAYVYVILPKRVTYVIINKATPAEVQVTVKEKPTTLGDFFGGITGASLDSVKQVLPKSALTDKFISGLQEIGELKITNPSETIITATRDKKTTEAKIDDKQIKVESNDLDSQTKIGSINNVPIIEVDVKDGKKIDITAPKGSILSIPTTTTYADGKPVELTNIVLNKDVNGVSLTTKQGKLEVGRGNVDVTVDGTDVKGEIKQSLSLGKDSRGNTRIDSDGFKGTIDGDTWAGRGGKGPATKFSVSYKRNDFQDGVLEPGSSVRFNKFSSYHEATTGKTLYVEGIPFSTREKSLQTGVTSQKEHAYYETLANHLLTNWDKIPTDRRTVLLKELANVPALKDSKFSGNSKTWQKEMEEAKKTLSRLIETDRIAIRNGYDEKLKNIEKNYPEYKSKVSALALVQKTIEGNRQIVGVGQQVLWHDDYALDGQGKFLKDNNRKAIILTSRYTAFDDNTAFTLTEGVTKGKQYWGTANINFGEMRLPITNFEQSHEYSDERKTYTITETTTINPDFSQVYKVSTDFSRNFAEFLDSNGHLQKNIIFGKEIHVDDFQNNIIDRDFIAGTLNAKANNNGIEAGDISSKVQEWRALRQAKQELLGAYGTLPYETQIKAIEDKKRREINEKMAIAQKMITGEETVEEAEKWFEKEKKEIVNSAKKDVEAIYDIAKKKTERRTGENLK